MHVALYRRARHRSVRAKHAAIARKGLEPLAASFAVIEKLAGISRHRLDGLMAAFRTRQGALKLHMIPRFAPSIPQEQPAGWGQHDDKAVAYAAAAASPVIVRMLRWKRCASGTLGER